MLNTTQVVGVRFRFRPTKGRRRPMPAALWRRAVARSLVNRVMLKRAAGQKLRALGNVHSGKTLRCPTIGLRVKNIPRWLADEGTFFFRSGGGRYLTVQLMASASTELKCIFGRNFRAARRNSKLTQEAVTKRTGVAQSEVSKIERLDPRANPTLETMARLAMAVNVPLHELLKPE